MPGFTCVNQPHDRHLQPTSGNKNPMISPSSLDRAPSRTRSTNSYMRHDPTHSPFSAPKEPKAMRNKSPKVVLPVNAQHSKSYHSDLAPEFNSSHKTRAVTPPQEHDNNSEDAPPDHPHDPKTPNHTYKGDKVPSPNARRKQPVRNVKLMASIEQSAKKAVFDSDTSGRDSITDSSFIGTMTPSSTCQSYRSKSGAHVIPVQRCRHARDDIWTPSSTRSDKPGFDESPDLSQGFSPSRHHVAEGRRCQALKSEPRDSQDSSRQNHDIIIRTSPSPFMCDADKQQRRLERHGVVEQNSFDYATARYEFAKRELLQEIRRKKGKSVDCRDDRQAYCLSEGNKKRKYDTKTMTGPRGEEKKMHKKVKCDLSTDDFDSKPVGNAEAISSEDQIAPAQSFRDEKAVLVGKPLDDVSRKQTRAIENGKLQAEMQTSKAVIKADSIISVSSTSEGHLKAKAPARKVHESPSTHSSRQNASSSSTTGSRKAQASRPWEHSRAIREISMPIIVHECTCTSLPEYFTQPRLTEPTLSSWGAGKAEFLAHVGQISQCRGHRERLIKYCRLILELEARAEEVFLVRNFQLAGG